MVFIARICASSSMNMMLCRDRECWAARAPPRKCFEVRLVPADRRGRAGALELGIIVGISRQPIVKIEGGHRVPSVNVQTVIAIKKIFEAQCIEFITAPDGSPCLVIKPKPIV
jgi:DNA-binding XRE family transcriptional regulator